MKFKHLKILPILLIFTFLISGCGGSIVGSAQDYKKNMSPLIKNFTSSLSESNQEIITPGTITTLTVTATDPENEKLKYEFSSDDGSFSSQTAIDNGVTVRFTVGNYIVSSQSITATVTVSDGHENSVSETLVVGKSTAEASVSITSVVPQYLTSTDQIAFTFTATETGLFQVQVLDSGDSIQFNSSYGQRSYYIGDEITITVDGPDVTSSTANVKMDDGKTTNVIALIFQNITGDVAHAAFKLTTDDDGPVCQIDSPTAASGTYNSVTPFNVSFSATDAGCGVSRISYTTDGSTPDFTGNGTVISGPSGSVSVGNRGLGDYSFKVVAMDELGNTGDVKIFSYSIVNESVPPGEAEVTLENYTDHGVKLSWQEPVDSDYDHIEFTWTVNGDDSGETKTVESGTTECEITGLASGQEITITASTVDRLGNKSDGITLSSITMKALPDITVGTYTDHEIPLSWSASGDGGYDHFVFTWTVNGVDSGETKTAESGTTQCQIDGVDDGDIVIITAKPYDASGGEYTTIVLDEITMKNLPPNEVSDIDTSLTTDTTATITWTEPTDGGEDDEDFNHILLTISWTIDGLTTSKSEEIEKGTTTYTTSELKDKTQVDFTIQTVDAKGNISDGRTGSVTTPDTPPDEVSNLKITAISDSAVSLEWTNPDNVDYASCSYVLKDASTKIDDGTITDFSQTDLTFSNDISAETEYTFTITTCDTSGNSSDGKTIEFTTLSSGETVIVINDAAGLQAISGSNSYYLGNDLDLTGITWTSISSFSGTFYGDGKIISNLDLTSSSGYTGLFNTIESGGKIKDLHLKNVTNSYGSGQDTLFVCSNMGTIERCSVSGTLNNVNHGYHAGLVYNNWGTISQCWATGTVQGANNTGAIAAFNYSEISNCYCKGMTVQCQSSTHQSKGSEMGGIVASNEGTVSNCYFSGVINGYLSSASCGLLAGINSSIGSLTNCFFDSSTDSTITEKIGTNIGNISTSSGLDFYQMIDAINYTGWDFNYIWAIDTDINDGYPYLIHNPPRQ